MLELESHKGVKEKYMFTYNEVFLTEPKEFAIIFKEFCLNSFAITPAAIQIL